MKSEILQSGYKKTEIGVIPEDWEVISLGDFADIFVGRDLKKENISTFQDDVYRYPVYSNTVDNKGLFGYYDFFEYLGESVTVVGRGIGLGTAFERSGKYAAIGRLLVLFPNKRINSSYLTEYINKKIIIFKESSGIPQLTAISLAKYNIPIPPLPEQTAIAEVLSDTDALLTALDKLIAKKRDIKQAAMQELLTGKKRLPGFGNGKGYKKTEIGLIPEDWDVRPFSEIAFIRKRKSDHKKTGIFCVELENIAQGKGKLNSSNETTENSSSKAIFKEGDVLFGRLRAYLRKYWLADVDGVCSTEIWPFVAKSENTTSKFLFQLIRTNTFLEVASTAYGTHMPRSDWNLVKKYLLSLPSLPEQTAIATILSDMDAEITKLEQKRDKVREIKEGMMQELLTGKVRLVGAESAGTGAESKPVGNSENKPEPVA